MAMEMGELTGEVYRFGEPEPVQDVRVRSAFAEWERGADGLWRVANVSTAGNAYTWEQLSRCFRTLREVTRP